MFTRVVCVCVCVWGAVGLYVTEFVCTYILVIIVVYVSINACHLVILSASKLVCVTVSCMCHIKNGVTLKSCH